MNFFLDENFPKKANTVLTYHGHIVFDIRGTDKEGMTDNTLFDLAKEKEAVFLTTDKDFYHTIHLTSKPHHGIVVIALRQPNSDAIIEKLNWVIDKMSSFSFENRCLLMTDTKCIMFK